MHEPFLSVIIPCYNVGHCVEQSVMSVVNQTFKDYEIICVDNNSTDDTWKVLCDLQKEIPTLVLAKAERRGACSARNKGLEYARGPWLQFLDADDILLPEKLSHQAALVQQGKDILFVAGSYKVVNVSGEPTFFYVQNGSVWQKLLEGSLGCTISNLFSRSAIEKVGGWDLDQQSSQEFKLMFDLLRAHPGMHVLYDEKINSVYQKRGVGSISFNQRDNIIRYIELRRMIWEHILENRIREVSQDFYLNVIFQKLRILYRLDHQVAESLHDELIPMDFVPAVSTLTPKYYILLYRLCGFKYSEKIIMAGSAPLLFDRAKKR